MKTKNPLERKRPLFFTAGLLFAVSLALVSFEWRTPYQAPAIPDLPTLIDDEVVWVLPVKLKEPEKKIQKPEPPQKQPEPSTEFDVVDEEVIDEPNPDDLVINEDDLVDAPDIVKVPVEADVEDTGIDKVWTYAGVMPEYCGGEKAMFEFLYSELVYPDIPRQNGVSGKVHVRFVVGKDGKLRDAEVMRPIDPWLDAEALRVAKKLTCFTPGRQAGRNVDVYFVLPINFVLK